MHAVWVALILVPALGTLVAIPAAGIFPWFVARSRFAELARTLGTSASSGVWFQAAPAGVPTTFTLEQPKGALRPRLVLTQSSPDAAMRSAELAVRPTSFFDRLGTSLRINRKMEVGDAAFDRRTYIETSESERVVRALLADPTVRRAIAELLDLGFSSVTLGGATLAVATLRAPTKESFSADRVTRAAKAAGVVASAVAAQTIAPAAPPPNPSPSARAASVVLPIATFFAHVPAILATRTFQQISSVGLILGVGIGVGVAIAMAPFVVVNVRGKTDSFRSFLWVFFATLWLFPCLSIAALFTANGALDGSPLHDHRCIVRQRTLSTGKNRRVTLEVEGLEAQGEVTKLDFAPGVYVFDRGEAILIDVGDGALGMRWIREIRGAPPARPKK